MTLWDEWQEAMRLMERAVSEASERGKRFSVKNAAYYARKTEVALILKADGVPVTLISLILKGDERVAPLLLEKECAEAEYKAACKAIDVYRDKARMLYDQIKREQSGDAW